MSTKFEHTTSQGRSMYSIYIDTSTPPRNTPQQVFGPPRGHKSKKQSCTAVARSHPTWKAWPRRSGRMPKEWVCNVHKQTKTKHTSDLVFSYKSKNGILKDEGLLFFRLGVVHLWWKTSELFSLCEIPPSLATSAAGHSAKRPILEVQGHPQGLRREWGSAKKFNGTHRGVGRTEANSRVKTPKKDLLAMVFFLVSSVVSFFPVFFSRWDYQAVKSWVYEDLANDFVGTLGFSVRSLVEDMVKQWPMSHNESMSTVSYESKDAPPWASFLTFWKICWAVPN